MPFTSARNSDCVFYEQGDGLPCGTSLHYYESIEDSFPNKVFSVAHYLGLRAVALLTVSDIHPIEQEATKWEWHMTEEAFLFSGAKLLCIRMPPNTRYGATAKVPMVLPQHEKVEPS